MLGTLCTLITALTYVSCQKAVTQTPSVLTVSTKGTATFHCDITKYESQYVLWYKQVPGGAPQYVLRFYRTHGSPDEYGSGFSSDRFTSKATSDKDYQFIISNVEETDSAVYYCHTWDKSVKVHVFGPGTKLIVTDGDLATPAVTLFPPSTEDLKSSRATLVCLTSDLSQRSKGLADVSWMSSGESVTEDVSTSPAEQQPDNTFRISSYLTIQTADWDKDVVFTCKVSLGSTFSEKEIRKTSCSL
ncbi:immunoglobulin lambda-1 light chain-like [Oncorhynchus kisutch]|uniref:Immunoglobulin lambda-1 light chain n=1 Tax=Oncorhynchus kisutch TaxID=8019 RepID=A0A8C7K044_ONCKI|nr:immunoglobulin lambda-1 light chain [Oncorhynchus kisutch]XP_031673134.1 immunoglobulin lambda-1 light chain-like [Oncorhynchus kisutch]